MSDSIRIEFKKAGGPNNWQTVGDDPGVSEGLPVVIDQTAILAELAAISSALGSVGAGASALVDGRQVVAVTDTPIALGSGACKTIFITALTTNSDVVVIGGATVDFTLATRTGKVMYPGDSLTISIDNLSKVFINGTANDGVSFSYLT